MDEDRGKAARLVIGLFLSCLCLALACFGIFVYIAAASRGETVVSERTAAVSKIIVMTGIFFLVLAFGHLLPILISHKRRKHAGRKA